LKTWKPATLLTVQYWDHYGDSEGDISGALLTVTGYYVATIKHKHPLLKLSMHKDLSWPFMLILTSAIEKVKEIG